MKYSKGFLDLIEEERAKENSAVEREDAANVQGRSEVEAPKVGATNRIHDGGRKLDPQGDRQRAPKLLHRQEQPGEEKGRPWGRRGISLAPKETSGAMTVTEALIRARDLLHDNQDKHNTMHGVLDNRTEEAIRKLMMVAFDATFRKTTLLAAMTEREKE